MKKDDRARQSICSVCGKRLSSKTPGGDIHWLACHLDDKGIYCNVCYKPKGKDHPRKASRAKGQ